MHYVLEFHLKYICLPHYNALLLRLPYVQCLLRPFLLFVLFQLHSRPYARPLLQPYAHLLGQRLTPHLLLLAHLCVVCLVSLLYAEPPLVYVQNRSWLTAWRLALHLSRQLLLLFLQLLGHEQALFRPLRPLLPFLQHPVRHHLLRVAVLPYRPQPSQPFSWHRQQLPSWHLEWLSNYQ